MERSLVFPCLFGLWFAARTDWQSEPQPFKGAVSLFLVPLLLQRVEKAAISICRFPDQLDDLHVEVFDLVVIRGCHPVQMAASQ